MAALIGDRVRYDDVSGRAVLRAWQNGIDAVDGVAVPRWGPGFGLGPGADRFAGAFDDLRREVDDRLDEQVRVGRLVSVMMLGVHGRVATPKRVWGGVL